MLLISAALSSADYALGRHTGIERKTAEDSARSLVDGIHRFLFEEQADVQSERSRTQLRKECRERAYRVVQRNFNRAFVMMEYFGYLRRNANDAPDGNFDGYNYWLDKLESFGGDYRASNVDQRRGRTKGCR